MIRFRNISIRHQLTVVVMLTSGIALLLTCAGFILLDYLTLRRAIEGELTALAEIVGNNSVAALTFDDRVAAHDNLRTLREHPHVEVACLFKGDGSTFASYRRPNVERLAMPTETMIDGEWFQAGHLLLMRRIMLGREIVGIVYLQSDLTQLNQQMAQYLGIGGIVMLMALLVALLVSRKLQRVVSDPITALAATARIVTEQKDYSIRAPSHGQDETRQLIDAFNQMLAQIQARDQAVHEANQQLEARVASRTAKLRHELNERRRTEAALVESRRNYRELVDSLDGIVWEAQVDTLQVTFVSKQAERLLGYPVDQWHQPSFWQAHIHEEDRDRVISHTRREIEVQRGHEIEYRMMTAAGQIVWIRDIVTVVVEKGRASKLRGVMIDITESKHTQERFHRAEEQLRHSQKMEAVGRLAGGVAHDFNNLLTVINGYTELLDKQIRANPNLHRLVTEVQRASDRAAALTRQLLAFGRKQVLQPRPFDLNVVLRGMEKMLRRVLGENMELTTYLEPTLAHVSADPGQIEQVILNLAINARDAMTQGGQLIIQTKNVVLDEDQETTDGMIAAGEYVVLRIRDTGSGMTDEVKAHLFEPFFTTKEAGKGTGLGLATSYGIVKQSNGFITVLSELGRGTEMCLYFQANQSELSPAHPEANDTELPSGRETLLVVEDEPAVRDLEVCVLRECGYNVLEAGNGAEGLRVVRDNSERKIDLVISDCIMPQMNGKDMVDRLRVLLPETKVLFVSGYTDDLLADQGVFNSGAAFLQKPFSAKNFAQKVRETLDQPAVANN